ncbi:ABC transporter substrate-binding protein [bacterium]|nr:MAG: ABC transporter substrate-binding protein [bacterium]
MRKSLTASVGWLLAFLLWISSASAASELKKVRLSYAGWEVGTAVAYVGIDGGIFKQYGVEVEEVFIRDTLSAGVQSLIGVDFLLGFGNPLAILQPLLAGADIISLCSHVSIASYGMGVTANIAGIKELKGKKIGVSEIGGRSDLAARVILRRAGLDPVKDVEMVAAGLGPNRVAALSKNLIQGAPLPPEIAERAKQLGAKVLDVKEVPLITAMLMTTRSFIKKDEEAVRRFMKGYLAAIHFYLTRKDESIAIIKKYFSGADPLALEEMYNTYAAQLKPLPAPNREAAQALIDVAAVIDSKSKSMKPADLFEPRFLEELRANGFIDELYSEKVNL